MINVRVLIVEDMGLTALGMDSKMRKMGHEVVERVDSGEEAIRAAEEHLPDVILMDVNIKGMNGIMAAREIVEKLNLPIVFTTAYTNDSTKAVIEEMGIQEIVGKPYNDQLLARAISSALSKHVIMKK